jgi:hypothetical protein
MWQLAPRISIRAHANPTIMRMPSRRGFLAAVRAFFNGLE